MAKPKNSEPRAHLIALIQNVGLVALADPEIHEKMIFAKIFTFNRNSNNTGWVFNAIPIFYKPRISMNSIILLETMPEELLVPFNEFLKTIE